MRFIKSVLLKLNSTCSNLNRDNRHLRLRLPCRGAFKPGSPGPGPGANGDGHHPLHQISLKSIKDLKNEQIQSWINNLHVLFSYAFGPAALTDQTRKYLFVSQLHS
jgi:hypothetical protein